MRRAGQWWWPAARAVVLAAVLAGLFGMHVLTAEDTGAGHGALPMIDLIQQGGGHDPGMVAADAAMDATSPAVQEPTGHAPPGRVEEFTAAGSGFGGGHGEMAGCILFLVIGGAAVLLIRLRRRLLSPDNRLGWATGAAVSFLRRRGPPPGWTRLSLCVIRV